MKKTLAIYALLLVTSLVFAYRSWTAEEGPDLAEAVVVLQISADDLVGVRYDSEKIDVALEVREDDAGRFVWVNAQPKAVAEAEQPEQPANPHAPPPVDTTPEEFKAGVAGDRVIEGLAPFVAKRILEGVDEAKLDELGLANAEATLSIEREGRDAKTYEVGGGVYGGSNVYVRDPETGTIYVVDAKVIRPLQNAKRTLVDRTLFEIPQKDITRVTIRAGDAEATFEQRNPDDAQATFWASPEASEANETAGGWLDKALRLKTSSYVQPGEEPADLEEVFSFAVQTAGADAVVVSVYRAWGEDGEESWYGRSAHTRALVALQRAGAAETAADVATVLDSAG